MSLMQTQSSKKFWSFKDTKTHKRLNEKYLSKDTIRFFVFDKSFLLQIKCKEDENKSQYVIPYKFMSNRWPQGFYTGLSDDGIIYFTDRDIIRVIG